MNNLDIFVCYRQEDILHLNRCLEQLNNYKCNVYIVKTTPVEVLTADALTRPKELKQTEYNNIYSNLNINHFEYKYFSGKDWYNFKTNIFDFSEVKNLAFQICKSKFILFLDSDELLLLDPDFIEWFNSLNDYANIGAFNFNVFSYVQINSESSSHHNKQERLILNDKIRYKNRVHESIKESLKENNLVTLDTPNMIIHRGYNNPDVIIPKSKRNIGLIASVLFEQPTNKYFIDKFTKQIENYLQSLNMQVSYANNANYYEVLKDIQLNDVDLTLNLDKFMNEIKRMLTNVMINQTNYELLNQVFYKYNYLLNLGII